MSMEARMPGASPIVTIDSLDLDAQGVARQSNEEGGKVLFIRGALPTEQVSYTITREKARFAKAKLNELIKPAVYRTTPRCT